MKRREFLKIGMTGVVALSLNPYGCSWGKGDGAQLASTGAGAAVTVRNLVMTEALFEMVDLRQVYQWAFEDPNQTDPTKQGPRFPGPLIKAVEGETIRLTVTNALHEGHGFIIPSSPGQQNIVDLGVIPPGEARTAEFTAPAAGSYLYFDPLNGPVNRVLGLHGALVVLPKAATNPYGAAATAPVQQLFADLGTTAEFPGSAWDPARTWLWQFHSIDPKWNDLAQAGQPIDAVQFQNGFLPRYFTINGKSGFFSSHDMDTALAGRVGQPALVRIMNTGMATHSPHLHANHVYVTALNGEVQSNVFLVDTFTLRPLDRLDWLVPFHRPPDIPDVALNNPNNFIRLDAAQELALSFGGVPQSPLDYPMHCHMEMSQTAAGGNYPQGMVTHFTFTGDVDGTPFPA